MDSRIDAFPLASSNRPRLDSIEPRIRALVDALNATGLVETFTSCEGHFGFRGPPGDVTLREQANVGFFLGRGVPEEALVRFVGKVLAEYHLHAVSDVVFEVSKRYVAALDGTDVPEVYFEFTVRPFDYHASDEAKRSFTDRALAEITGSVERMAPPRLAEGAGDSSRADIEAALAAHGRWKTRLTAVIASGITTVDIVDARQDDRCTIGKWLHGTPDLKTYPRYREIVDLHARFHREASRALELVANEGGASELVDATRRYYRTSVDLTRALESWAA